MTPWITVKPEKGNSLYVNSDEQRYVRIPIVHVTNRNNNIDLLDLTVFPTAKSNPVHVYGLQWSPGQSLNIKFLHYNKEYKLILDTMNDMARSVEPHIAYISSLFVDGCLDEDFKDRLVYTRQWGKKK